MAVVSEGHFMQSRVATAVKVIADHEKGGIFVSFPLLGFTVCMGLCCYVNGGE